MARRKLSRVESGPSLDALRFFCDFCRAFDAAAFEPGGATSLAAIAERSLHVSPADLSQRLSALERALSLKGRTLRLIERSPGSKRTTITDEGRLLLDEAQRLLDSYEGLPGRLKPAPPEIRIATTNAILVNVLGGALASYFRQTPTMPRLVFKEYDYPEIVKEVLNGGVEFGVGPHLPPNQYPELRFRELFTKATGQVDMVVVCPPNHALARARRATVELQELGTLRLFVLRGGLQPGLAHDLPATNWAAGGSRIEMPSYTTILALVRMGLGVGLMPGWYWVLDDLCKQGLIYYALVPELGPVGLSVYSRRDAKPHALVNELVDAIVEHVPRLQRCSLHERKPWHNEFPPSLEHQRFLYHVSCVGAGCAYPEWRQSKIYWRKSSRGRVYGTVEDIDVRGEYSIRGTLSHRFLSWTAEGWTMPRRRRVPDRFMAAFNGFARSTSVLVGTWVGFDDERSPVSGPMILAPESLPLDQLTEISLSAQPYVFVNAERTHDQGLADSKE